MVLPTTHISHLCHCHCHYYCPPNPVDQINSHLASLSNEQILDFLADRVGKSGFDDELKGIKPDLLSETDSFGQTILHLAADKDDLGVINFLLSKVDDDTFMLKTKHDGYTALHLAVHGGNCEVISSIVKASHERNIRGYVDWVDSHGQTALHHAAYRGHVEICKKLYIEMSNEAILCEMKDRRQTVLHFAVQGGSEEVVTLLLSREGIAKELLLKKDKYGQTALHFAAGKPYDKGRELVKILIETAQRICSRAELEGFLFQAKMEGYTALHSAAQSKSDKIVQLLVEVTQERFSKFVSTVDHYGQTALHWAASDGSLEICQTLCEKMNKGEIDTQMKDRQQTALHFAVQGGHYEVAKLLIEKGADKGIKDSNGRIAFDWIPSSLEEEKKRAFESLLKV